MFAATSVHDSSNQGLSAGSNTQYVISKVHQIFNLKNSLYADLYRANRVPIAHGPGSTSSSLMYNLRNPGSSNRHLRQTREGLSSPQSAPVSSNASQKQTGKNAFGTDHLIYPGV